MNTTEEYDIETNIWTVKTAMPMAAYGMQANVVGDKIYVTGGATAIGSVGQSINYMYDPQKDTWDSRMLPPYDITSLCSAVVDKKIFFVGALTASSGLWNGTFMLQAYDTVTDSWSIVTASPTSYESGNGGGATSGSYGPHQILFFSDNTTYAFDVANSSWSVGLGMPTQRVCASVAIVNDSFYVIGGRSGTWGYITITNASNVTERYVPQDYAASSSPSVPELQPWMLITILILASIIILTTKTPSIYHKNKCISIQH